MIKKLFSALCVVFFATSMMAQTGLTCEDPIPVDSTYRARVEGPCVMWYQAGTYDLPLNVHFVPDNPESDWGPEVQVDFTCIPGVYADSKIDSLINLVGAFDVEFPLEILCDRAGTDEHVEWDLFVNSSYRDQLAEFGVTYNVQAFVRVEFFEAGLIRLQPDTIFSSCMDSADPIALDQEISILPNDSDRVFIMPYTDWQNDSIQFVWNGDAPATIWLATGACDFLPSVISGYVCANYYLQPGVPYRVHNKDITNLIKENSGGGVFYAKILSSAEGTLLTEKIPMSAIQGDAILLEHGKTVELPASAADLLFCFPKTWGATMFEATTNKMVTMYIGHSADFEASASDANVVASVPFGMDNGTRTLYLSSTELATYKSGLTEDYVYVRFVSEEAMSITPNMWAASVCADASTLIVPNTEYSLKARSGNTIFRMRYADFEGYPLGIYWRGSSSLPVYISDTCHYVLSGSNEHVLKYVSIRSGNTSNIDVETLSSWEARAEDGYFYVRFNPSNAGRVKFISERPAAPDSIYTTISETLCYGESYEWNGQSYSTAGEYKQSFIATNGADSIVTLKLTILPEVAPTTEEATIEAGESYTWNGKEYTEAGEYTITLQDKNGCDYQATLVLKVNKPLSPCLQSSIKLNVGDKVVINLDSAFTVYAIDYAAWMAQPVTLVWTGAEALHTFVAETCVFALAPYNKYVHAYVPVPAQGDSALDMEALAPYVDEDGYLYVRFLTEFEGVLTIDN